MAWTPAIRSRSSRPPGRLVLTHGAHGGPADTERVDYGCVRSVLQALGGRTAWTR